MKIKQIVDEHKKGVRAHKYTKKTVNPSAVHAKAKEKLQAIKPMEDMSSSTTGNDQEGTIVASDDKSITVQMPDGTQIKKDLLGAITQDAQGNDVFNMTTQPGSPTNPTTQQTPQQRLAAGTKIAISNQAPQQTMGAPARPMAEELEPSNSSNTVNAIKKGAQLFASDGDPIEITSTRKEVDQAYIADPANAGNRMGYVVFKGKKYLALNTGHKWKIGPNAFAEITGIMHLPATRNPAPSVDSRSQPLPQPNQRMKPSEIHKLEESDNALLDKMLTIAGLR